MAVLLGAGLVVAGCSSSDDGTGSDAAAFVEAADAICADFFAAVAALDAPSFTADDPPSTLTDDQVTEGVEALEAYLEIEDEQLARLRDLEPPRADEREFETLLESWAARRAAAGDALDAFGARDDDRYEAASSEITVHAFAGAAAAQALGLQECQGEG